LEIPPQKDNIQKEVLEHATNSKVIIRDINGKIYNPQILKIMHYESIISRLFNVGKKNSHF
jgi:hypothetical protein